MVGPYKIWYTSDMLWDIRDKNKLNGNATAVRAYCGCRAIAYAVTGDYMEEDL